MCIAIGFASSEKDLHGGEHVYAQCYGTGIRDLHKKTLSAPERIEEVMRSGAKSIYEQCAICHRSYTTMRL